MSNLTTERISKENLELKFTSDTKLTRQLLQKLAEGVKSSEAVRQIFLPQVFFRFRKIQRKIFVTVSVF